MVRLWNCSTSSRVPLNNVRAHRSLHKDAPVTGPDRGPFQLNLLGSAGHRRTDYLAKMLRADAYDGSFFIEPLPVALADAVIDARLAFQHADRSVEIDGLSHSEKVQPQ